MPTTASTSSLTEDQEHAIRDLISNSDLTFGDRQDLRNAFSALVASERELRGVQSTLATVIVGAATAKTMLDPYDLAGTLYGEQAAGFLDSVVRG